jgi:hypothetical protein
VEAVPRLVFRDQDSMDRNIRSIQALVACFPQAATLLARMLVDEGRSFAQKEEGQRLLRALSNSEWVEHGRILWEACGLDALLTDAPERRTGILPSAWIRLLQNSLATTNLEQTLSNLMVSQSPTVRDHVAQSNPTI